MDGTVDHSLRAGNETVESVFESSNLSYDPGDKMAIQPDLRNGPTPMVFIYTEEGIVVQKTVTFLLLGAAELLELFPLEGSGGDVSFMDFVPAGSGRQPCVERVPENEVYLFHPNQDQDWYALNFTAISPALAEAGPADPADPPNLDEPNAPVNDPGNAAGGCSISPVGSFGAVSPLMLGLLFVLSLFLKRMTGMKNRAS